MGWCADQMSERIIHISQSPPYVGCNVMDKQLKLGLDVNDIYVYHQIQDSVTKFEPLLVKLTNC